jgi:hypothetical protein
MVQLVVPVIESARAPVFTNRHGRITWIFDPVTWIEPDQSVALMSPTPKMIRND